MGSLIVRSTPEREVWVPELCSWARHFTLTVVYKWVMENLLRYPCDGLTSYPGEYPNTPSQCLFVVFFVESRCQ